MDGDDRRDVVRDEEQHRVTGVDTLGPERGHRAVDCGIERRVGERPAPFDQRHPLGVASSRSAHEVDRLGAPPPGGAKLGRAVRSPGGGARGQIVHGPPESATHGFGEGCHGRRRVCSSHDRGISLHGLPNHGSGSRGSPRTRSPRMFLLTSVVPPSMVLARLRSIPPTSNGNESW